MGKETNQHSRDPGQSVISRRTVLAGAASAAILAATPIAFAAGKDFHRYRGASGTLLSGPVQRYLASSVLLPDGRVMVIGGYDRPWNGGKAPMPSSSVFVFDPDSEAWSSVAEMNLPRARHAAVVMTDGRVAVLGGISKLPTASVEIYDPRTDQWTIAQPLQQARYDHTATIDGGTVYVLGGSGQRMISTVEVLRTATMLDKSEEME